MINKKKLKEVFIREKNYVNKGIGEISGIRSIAGTLLLLSVWLKQHNIEIPASFIIIASLILLAGFRMFGWYWDKSHLYVEEMEFGNRRNKLAKEIRKAIRIRKL